MSAIAVRRCQGRVLLAKTSPPPAAEAKENEEEEKERAGETCGVCENVRGVPTGALLADRRVWQYRNTNRELRRPKSRLRNVILHSLRHYITKHRNWSRKMERWPVPGTPLLLIFVCRQNAHDDMQFDSYYIFFFFYCTVKINVNIYTFILEHVMKIEVFYLFRKSPK